MFKSINNIILPNFSKCKYIFYKYLIVSVLLDTAMLMVSESILTNCSKYYLISGGQIRTTTQLILYSILDCYNKMVLFFIIFTVILSLLIIFFHKAIQGLCKQQGGQYR